MIRSEAVNIDYVYPDAMWRTSTLATGDRQLVIVTLLRPFLDSADHERWAAQLIAYYTASLPDDALQPDLDFFAQYYLDSSGAFASLLYLNAEANAPIAEVHHAARLLFAATMDRSSEEEIASIVDARLAACRLQVYQLVK